MGTSNQSAEALNGFNSLNGTNGVDGSNSNAHADAAQPSSQQIGSVNRASSQSRLRPVSRAGLSRTRSGGVLQTSPVTPLSGSPDLSDAITPKNWGSVQPPLPSTGPSPSTSYFSANSPITPGLLRSISSSQINTVRRLSRNGYPSTSPIVERERDRQAPRFDTQAQYMQQERAYLSKLRANMTEDYHGKKLNPVGNVEFDIESSLDEDEDTAEEIAGFGGIGTSFDDAYTDLGTNFKFLESEAAPGVKNRAKLRERTEWQAMLTSVLTGEVFRSEKTRIRAAKTSLAGGQEYWMELRARVLGRCLADQVQLVSISRGTVSDVLEKVMTFRAQSLQSVSHVYDEVSGVLDSVSNCEALWHTLKAMRHDVPLYAKEEFQDRVEALTAWHTIMGSIRLEVKLLREWTGNDAADPSIAPKVPDGEPPIPSLVESVMKQDDALMTIFEARVQRYIFPLIRKAREQSMMYAHLFVEMGLPLFRETLEMVIRFPVTLIREIIELRLQFARKLVNPTIIIIDQTIYRFQQYMTLGLVLTSEYLDLTRPMFDKGWIVSRRELNILNSTLLESITFYLELLINKFLDGGKSSMSFFRSFKSIEQLEQHYNFLQDTCLLIEGGDISVAEKFSSLHSRVMSRLLAYWEHQMEGPSSWNKVEIERWFAATIENIRSVQRKLLRFYKVLSENYENAIDFDIPKSKMRSFMEDIRASDLFLVFVGSLEREGIYTFASADLRDQPDVIKKIIQGFSRVRTTGQESADDPVPGCVLILTIEEPLVWDGEIYHLDMPAENMLGTRPGRVRLVSQGGFAELRRVREQWTFLDKLEVAVDRRAHLAKVDTELNRIRTLFYKVSHSVILSALNFRAKAKPYEVQETVQQMYAFAREFGQRGLPFMGPAKRGRVALKLIDLCVDWVSFVSDDCPPSEPKTFRWTAVALEFAMVMTRGVNIVAISEEKFTELRRKVADCVTLLISHFDIMGARSKAEQESKPKLLPKSKSQVALENDDQLIALLREPTIEKLAQLEAHREEKHMVGKILDDSNTEFEFLNFASSSLSNTTMRWQQGRYIGSGAFGSVYEAQNLDSGQVMAVKEIRLQNHQSIGHILKSIKDEMTVLEILRHPNVVQYYGVEVHRERVFIFMEYCDNGSLGRLLEYGRIEDETVTQMYSLQMLEGLAYLHQSGIIHRDIKPENILLDHMGVIKFVDFGAAKVIANTSRTMAPVAERNKTHTRITSLTGTPMYMSPEIITGQITANHGSMDIWSIGCCILEMVTGRRPWANLDNEWAIMYHIAQNHMPAMPTEDQATPACREFLLRTLERNPEKRPSAMTLLSDPWIVSVRNQLLGLTPESEDKRIE